MKKKFALLSMNLIYYFTFVLLLIVLIFPHTTFFYSTHFGMSFLERVNTHNIYLVAGESYKIKPFSIKHISTYKTYNFRVADVMPWGTVIAKHPGTTAVQVKCNGNKFRYRVYVFQISKSRLCIGKGERKRLRVKNRVGRVRWKSMDKRIATVNQAGLVKGENKGETYVSARVKGRTLRCRITVR